MPMSANSERDTQKKKRFGNYFHLTSLGWELAIPIVGGPFLGYRLDQLLETGYAFTLIFLLLGIVAGYYSLYRAIELEMLRTKFAKLKEEKEETD